MDSKIIDGRTLAYQKEQSLREKISQLKDQGVLKFPIRVVDFCNYQDPTAEVYLNLKVKKAESLGIDFILVDVDRFSAEEFKRELSRENEDPENSGVMIQVPLPEQLYSNQQEFIDLINPQKDVDGLKLNGQFPSATGQAVMDLLDSVKMDYKAHSFTVVGSEGVEGGAIVKLLKDRGAEVKGVDKKDRSTSLADIQHADVVISATGQKGLITADMVKDGVIAVDVGLGEFTEDVYGKAQLYTPKSGGVGPMTIICLMENVIKAAASKN